MEHKWGREVAECGVGDMGATLCTRFLAAPDNTFLTNAVNAAGNHIIVQVGVDTRYNLILFTPPTSKPHFPYQWGAQVEPDAPV